MSEAVTCLRCNGDGIDPEPEVQEITMCCQSGDDGCGSRGCCGPMAEREPIMRPCDLCHGERMVPASEALGYVLRSEG
jgi:hypothetical protein